MRENGWQGRSLLVIQRETQYFAWTGSHRIAAAREVGLESIPCYVIAEEKLLPFEANAEWGHVEDRERLALLIKVGDEEAIHLMWLENRS